ncbi:MULTISPECIES: hypothetical protein [Halobacteriales]|uniref:hypothetical protein n=1 Tax=Halobacteriales TaxID=2235 RepID=UPI0020C36B6F|nr:hypothetical protein [Halomarina sp. BND7]
MEEVTDTKTYEWADEVVVEVMGTDEQGEFAIVSYHFAFEDIQNATIRLQGEIEPEHESHIVAALSDAGYTLTTSLEE